MYGFHSRAVRGALGAMLLALGACADEPTAPASPPQGEHLLTVADPFTVTNTNDSGIGSLRWVLSHTTGGETVGFDPSLAGRTITLDSAITFTKHFTLDGPAGKGITISGGGKTRLFLTHHTNVVTLRNVTLTGGKASGASGGVTNGLGHLVLENASVYGNQADGISAFAGGTLTLINTTVSGNISHFGPSGPDSPVKYPAIVTSGSLTLINSTIAYNTDGGVGGGSLLTMRNSIISNNGVGENCGGFSQPLVLEGTNIADDDSCGGITGATIADPKLAPLADNGGSTMTHALLVGSPAINTGADCTVQVDQRHFPRDAQCDVGAFEFAEFTTVALTVASSATFDKNGWAVLTGTVQCSRSETFDLHVELRQLQKSGQTTYDVHAVSTTPIACTTSVLPWSVALVATDRPFQVGDATATVATLNTEKWVTPASVTGNVKLFKGRK